MKEEVKIFENPAFGEVRTAGTSDEPLFCLTDVCKAVDLNPSQVARRLDKGVLSKHTLETEGGKQLVNFVNEDGLYDVILDSRKPEAKAFRKWITSEVLPSIRKSGGYIAAQPEETPEMILAKALRIADETMKRQQAQLAQAEQTISNQEQRLQMAEGQIEVQTQEIKEMKPLADYTTDVLQSKSTYTLTQVAKDLGFTSVYKFTDWCKERGILYYQSKQWIPNSKFSAQGYFATRTHKYIKKDDTIGTELSTVVTERGRMWLHALLDRAAEQAEETKRILPVKGTGAIDGEQFTVYLTELNNPCVIAREVYLLLGYDNMRMLINSVSREHKRRISICGQQVWLLSYEGVCEAIAKSDCVVAEKVFAAFKLAMTGKQPKQPSQATA